MDDLIARLRLRHENWQRDVDGWRAKSEEQGVQSSVSETDWETIRTTLYGEAADTLTALQARAEKAEAELREMAAAAEASVRMIVEITAERDALATTVQGLRSQTTRFMEDMDRLLERAEGAEAELKRIAAAEAKR